VKKPIKVFYSELSGRFYASQRYKVWPSGLVEITGEKFDVTNDIGVVIEKYALEFTVRKKWGSQRLEIGCCTSTNRGKRLWVL